MNKKDIRIVYMGTPEFSTVVLRGLINDGYNIVGIVSQPDKEVGRKRILEATPVKKVGLEYNIPVFQPIKLRLDNEFLKELNPDVIITCAYGQIVPTCVLELPKYGCLNVHGSLLPKLRGGAPMQRSLMNGDSQTGITLMQMIDKMDAGNMYYQKSIDINENDNYQVIHDKLSILGRDMLLEYLPTYIDQRPIGEPQNEEEVTYGYNIKREDEVIDFSWCAKKVHNLVRALDPQTGAHCSFNGQEVKIWRTHVVEFDDIDAEVGTIVQANKQGLIVKCGCGYLAIDEIQLQGKKRMGYKDFLNGCKEELLNKRFL